jgi:hypothetical protein
MERKECCYKKRVKRVQRKTSSIILENEAGILEWILRWDFIRQLYDTLCQYIRKVLILLYFPTRSVMT